MLGTERRIGRLLILLEGGICLVCAKLLVHGIPFRVLVLTIGRQTSLSPHVPRERDFAAMAAIGSALRAIGRRAALLRQCLPQAIAAHWMARRRNVPSTLFLGTRLESGRLSAHAWLHVGDRCIVGGETSGFHVIAKFGDA